MSKRVLLHALTTDGRCYQFPAMSLSRANHFMRPIHQGGIWQHQIDGTRIHTLPSDIKGFQVLPDPKTMSA